MLYLTRRERFSAAHKLWREDWSQEENFQTFGKCANPNWHGHNYELFVTVKGDINPETGFVVDLKAVGDVLKENVISELDHKNINLDTSFMKGKLASTENIAVAIWNEIERDIEGLGAKLHCVKISETENNSIEFYG